MSEINALLSICEPLSSVTRVNRRWSLNFVAFLKTFHVVRVMTVMRLQVSQETFKRNRQCTCIPYTNLNSVPAARDAYLTETYAPLVWHKTHSRKKVEHWHRKVSFPFSKAKPWPGSNISYLEPGGIHGLHLRCVKIIFIFFLLALQNSNYLHWTHVSCVLPEVRQC